MDLELLTKFLGCMLAMDNDLEYLPTQNLQNILANYKSDPRTEFANGLRHVARVHERKNHNEIQAMNIGLIVGALASHLGASGFDGRNFIQNVVDATIQEKIKRKNLLKETSRQNIIPKKPNADVIKSVDEWLNKFKGG